MTLPQLQSQIESEAVKAFNEKTQDCEVPEKVDEIPEDAWVNGWFEAMEAAKKFWLPQLHQATQRVAGQYDAALRSLEQAGNDVADMSEEFIQSRDVKSLTNYGRNIASIAKNGRSWLNHKSEGVPEELKTYTRPNTIDRNDLAP